MFDDLHNGKRTVAVPALVVGEVVHVTRHEAAKGAAEERGDNAPGLHAPREMTDEAVSVFLRRLGNLG